MAADIREGIVAVQLRNFIEPSQLWLIDFRYLTAAGLVLILSGFSLNGFVGLGIGVFALCIFFFFLYRGVKRLTLEAEGLLIHSLFVKSLELQITKRGCCKARLISLSENCILMFEGFDAGGVRPTGRACRKPSERVEMLLPRLNSFNHPSYASLIGWLESKGIAVDAPAELDDPVEALDLSGSRAFMILLMIFAVVLVSLAYISVRGTHPL